MELSSKNIKQWGLLVLIFVGVFLYRSVPQYNEQPLDAAGLAALQDEMQGYWYRIPSYPGSKAPKPLMEASDQQIIWERLQPSDATYEEALEFYAKELPWIGWDRVGEVKELAGFSSPVYVYRSGPYHLLLSKEPEGILLRMTWSAKLDLLVDARVRK